MCIILAALTLAVFAQTFRYEFVNLDDGPYVYENSTVTNGLSSTGFAQAFALGATGSWDPLPTLSHMADFQIYGLRPGGHHFTNVLLHTASVILLFLLLQRMTGAIWRSALVAALFAIHPLHVESVAWVSERKDVMSGLFFMLAIWAYVHYAAAPPKLSRYVMVVLWFVLGLLSKAMLATLPVILLLLDFWPLQRIEAFTSHAKNKHSDAWPRAILEKLPLFALSAVSGVMAMLAQQHAPAVQVRKAYSLLSGLENAVVAPLIYTGQMFYPARLSAFYPNSPNGLEIGRVGLGIIFLAAGFAAAILWRKTRPYILVGWLWYLVMLLPVSGLVQLGLHAHADRYTYLPQIGLYIALAWLAGGIWVALPRLRPLFASTAAAAVAALSVMAFIQTSYWRDSISLWTHAIACNPGNAVAHYGLATASLDAGREDDAMSEFQKAVDLQPDYAMARYNLGTALARKGQFDNAMSQFQAAVKADPSLADAHCSLAILLGYQGQADAAIAQYQEAVRLQPGSLQIRHHFGTYLLGLGRVNEAAEQFQAMLAIQPGSGQVRDNLLGIAWVLATSTNDAIRNGDRAVALAKQLLSLSGENDPREMAAMAAAYAETGRYADAAATAERARDVTSPGGKHAARGDVAIATPGLPFRAVSRCIPDQRSGPSVTSALPGWMVRASTEPINRFETLARIRRVASSSRDN